MYDLHRTHGWLKPRSWTFVALKRVYTSFTGLPRGTGPSRRQSKDCARARAEMEQGPYGAGPTIALLSMVRPGGDRRVKKDRARAEMGPSVIVLESEDGNKETYSNDTSLTF